jgi:dUTP pyrophosphatase
MVKTGIAVSIDPGKVGLIWPRSGLASKGISTDAGVIDANYRGEIKVVITNGTKHRYTIQAGDKIAQMLIQAVFPDEIIEVDTLTDTDRGDGGFGHTGR